MKAACLLTLVLCVLGSSTVWAQSTRTPGNEIKIDYDQHVKPILTAKCFGCHGPKQQQSGLRLDRRQPALRGGDYGPVITPGNSADSKLIQRITGSEAGLQMPPTGALEDEEIAVLRAWIDQGADMPGRTDTEADVRRPTDPKVQVFLDAIHAHQSREFGSALTADRAMARAADAAGSTALMHAAYAGTVEMMATLIDAGADVNAANDRRATALHWAITEPAKVRLLLLKGANVNARTVDGRTPLHLAATLPAGTAIVEMLLEAGADLHARSIVGATPLVASVAASLETSRLLLAKGADPNTRNGLGATPLMNAALLGGAETVSLLLEAGADPAIRTKRGETALANAANRGDLMSVKLLLDKGADVRNIDYRGYTPLMHAAYADDGTPELIRLLLSNGADVHAVGKGDTAGETAVTIAAKRGETEILRLLREAAGK